jgi:hypothetical protein
MCLLLAWVQFTDRVAIVTAVLPLVLVCGGRVLRRLPGRARADSGSLGAAGYSQRSTIWPGSQRGDGRHEVALGLAAVGSVGVAWAGARVLAAAGGYAAHPLPFTLAPLRLLWTHAGLTGWGILELYGANFLGVSGWAGIAFAVLHMAGLALAVAGAAVALGRFLRPRGVPDPGLAGPAPAGETITASSSEGCGIQSAPLGALCIPRDGRAARGGESPDTAEAGVPSGEMAASPRRQAARRRRAGQQRPAADLVNSVLAVAIVANLASYVLSIEPGTVLGTGYDAREIAAVLPLGAVLAGRVFGPKLAASLKRARSMRRPPPGRFHEISGNVAARQRPTFPDAADGAGTADGAGALAVLALGLLLAGYAVAFGWSAAQPRAVSGDEALADWLAGHGLRYGLGGASANVVTVDSGGRTGVVGVTVRTGRVRPLLYQSSAEAYDPRQHDATFLIAGAPAAMAGDAAEAIPAAAVRATFGHPARVYRFDGFTVDVWNVNLLTKMRE